MPRTLRRRGSFYSVEELIAAIEQYMQQTNRQPKPFVWTASVEKIIEKSAAVKSFLRRYARYPASLPDNYFF